MSDEMKVPTIVERLEAVAESRSTNPALARLAQEAANYIRDLEAPDVIEIVTESGEVLCVIEGDEATELTDRAVGEFVRRLIYEMAGSGSPG